MRDRAVRSACYALIQDSLYNCMRYTIYKITNTVNGKYYIGKHQTNNPMDGYLGSGKAIVSAVKMYEKNAFIKEVLFDFDNEVDMNRKEQELITEEVVNDPLSYNLGIGGEGGAHFKGKKHSDITKQKLSKLSRSQNRKPITQETRNKISEANRKRIVSEETRRKLSLPRAKRQKKQSALPIKKYKEKYVMTDEHKCNISLALKKSGIISESVKTTITCPHCNKTGQKLAMLRFHFDKCKIKRISEPASR